MLSLAQLLSSFFPVTPRTTLFTRMEKIHARRHCCNAKEIKLLKTVGGCHGSSANCTVIPKSDVENYCKTYMDPTKSLTKDIKEQRFELNKEDSEFSLSKSSKSPHKNNKEQLQPLSRSPTEELNSIFKVNKKRARKNIMFDLAVSKAVINNKRELEISPETGNSLCELAAIDMNVSSIDAENNGGHVTNSTQTPSMLNKLFKTKKFPKAKRKVHDRINPKHDAVKQRKKQRLSSGGDKVKLRSPSIQCKCETGNNEVSMTNEGFEFSHLVISDMEKYEKFSLNSGELKSPFSDVSSNDSGFSSTISKKFYPTKSEVESKSNEVATKLYPSNLKKLSPLNKTKRSPKKEREKEIWKAEGSISLSPPALVIRRCDNTWQVETKINKDNIDNVRKKLKLGKPSKATLKLENLNADRNNTDKVISAQEAIEISNAVLPAKNLFTQSLPRKREKKVFKMIKVSNVKRTKQIHCKKETNNISSTSNIQPECIMEPVEENEGPLIDRGIFPMKRRRRRRSKIEMQEVRRQQAIKRAVREAKREGKVVNDVPITKLNIDADQNMNSLLPNTYSLTKGKKEKKKEKTVIENKQPEDAQKKTSAAKQGSFDLLGVNEVKSFGSSPAVKSKEKSETSRNPYLKEFTKDSSGEISAEKTKKDLVDLKKPTTISKVSVKLMPVKSSLDVNSNFKLTSLFNGFPMLTVQGGSLCPAYSQVYSKEAKVPGPEHLLWKWHLGGPVIDKVNKVQYKTRKIPQKKTPLQLTSSNKMLSKAKKQKAKQLAREISKGISFTKQPPFDNIVVDSKLSSDKTVENNPVGSTNSSTNVNICNNDKSESKPLSPILTSVSKISLFEKSSCLYSSSVTPLDMTTSCVPATNTQVNISDLVDNTPQTVLTLSNQLRTIVAET